MYCQDCGADLGEQAKVCPHCGRDNAQGETTAAAEVGRKLKRSSLDALGALGDLLTNPVGGLAATYDRLGEARARLAGILLCGVFALAVALAVMLGARRWLGELAYATGNSPGIVSFVKLALGSLLAPAALATVAYSIRRLLGARRDVAVDIFTAGAALAPLSIAALAGGLLGAGNFEVTLLLLLVAEVYLVLILYAGLTTLGELSERAAAPSVPLMIVIAAWLAKVGLAALL